MADIAKAARVSQGTLYRHFAKRASYASRCSTRGEQACSYAQYRKLRTNSYAARAGSGASPACLSSALATITPSAN